MDQDSAQLEAFLVLDSNTYPEFDSKYSGWSDEVATEARRSIQEYQLRRDLLIAQGMNPDTPGNSAQAVAFSQHYKKCEERIADRWMKAGQRTPQEDLQSLLQAAVEIKHADTLKTLNTLQGLKSGAENATQVFQMLLYFALGIFLLYISTQIGC
jgi:hypothetical protein